MHRDFNVVIERDEDGLFVASVPALPGCHTQGATVEEVLTRIKEAIALHLDDTRDDVPNLELIGVQRVSIAA